MQLPKVLKMLRRILLRLLYIKVLFLTNNLENTAVRRYL